MTKLKTLFLVQKNQRVILDGLYHSIAERSDCDLRRLDSAEENNLKKYFQSISFSEYDRVIVFLRFKRIARQSNVFKGIDNLIFLEHDACQNYIPNSKYIGKFSAFYRTVPWARIIVSGGEVAKRLCGEGFDCVFVPKGFDRKIVVNKGLARDIEIGFIGTYSSKVYKERKELLESLAKLFPITLLRTSPGQEYVDTLNRIRFFISADVGLLEYMIKNFEAMAAGCILFAYDQGVSENKALGFEDMHNVVLYSGLDDLKEKLERLRGDSVLAQKIGARGQCLAETSFDFDEIGGKILEAAARPLRDRVNYPPQLTWFESIKQRFLN